MNKYSKVYLEEIEKHAFVGAAIRAGFSAAKPILSKGISGVAQNIKTVAPQIGKSVKNFSDGTVSGLGSMMKGYAITAKSNMPVGKKILTGLSNTFNAPWNTAKNILSKKPITQLTAKEIGTISGTAVPGLALTNVVDKSLGPQQSSEIQNSKVSPTNDIWDDLNQRSQKYR